MDQNYAAATQRTFEPRKVSEQDSAAYRQFALTAEELAAVVRPADADE